MKSTFLRSILLIPIFIAVLFLISGLKNTFAESQIYFFYGNGCPHCSEVEAYFQQNDLYSKYPIQKKEIYFNRDNAILYTQILDDLGIPPTQRGVPTVVIGNKVLVGDTPIIEGFEPATKEAGFTGSLDPDQITPEKPSSDDLPDINPDPDMDPTQQQPEQKNLQKKTDLTIFAVIAASAVDAINPCAFAVLIILMSTILVGGKGNKALRAGFAFAASIFISYFLMGLGLYKALEISNISRVFYKVIGILAIFLGLFNLKDWLWYGKGFLMEVPMSWRPALKKIISSVTSPLGAFGIGFLVSLFLLPCTSGPYIVILGMLADKVQQTRAVLYLLLYNLIFVSPMLIISYAVYKGFDPSKAEEARQSKLRTLHLIAGIVMILMGSVILLGWI